VAQAYVDDGLVVEKEGKRRIADMTKLDPIIYALDGRYYRIGEPIGFAYSEEKQIHPKGAGGA